MRLNLFKFIVYLSVWSAFCVSVTYNYAAYYDYGNQDDKGDTDYEYDYDDFTFHQLET